MPTIGFVGDVYPGPRPGLEVSPDVLRRLRSFDLLVANLEGPVTTIEEPAVSKGTHLRTAPLGVEILREMGIGVVSLANNHMYDFGVDGVEETTGHLDRIGITWVGVGSDLRSARTPRIIDMGGIRLGFLAYSSPTIETVCATPSSPGCAPLDEEIMRHDVSSLAESVDVAIVLLHWALTGYEVPTPDHRTLGESLIEAGATLVIGSHPHVIQGIVHTDSGLIAYSLGDFAFYPASAFGKAVNQYRARQTGLILSVDIGDGGVRGHDGELTRQIATLVSSESSPKRRRAVERASARLDDAGAAYQASWQRYVMRRTVSRTIRRLAPWRWRTIRRGTVRGFGVALREIFRRPRS